LEQIETAKAAGMVRVVASLKESYSNEWQDDVVSKPFRIPELIPKIEELITKSNATSTL
jgi:CheY-like chemotaxis protein